MIRSENMPDVDPLYQGNPDQAETDLAAIVEQYDDFGNRRNRILDFLLAIYGEHVSSDPFLLLDTYSDVRLYHELIGVKINLLKAIG